MEDTVAHVIQANDPIPDNDVLQFADKLSRIRSITVVNQSQMLLSFFPNAKSSGGSGAFYIGPMQQQTIPLQAAQYVTVAYSGQNSTKGFVYIHYTSEYLAPNSSSLSSNTEGVIWVASGVKGIVAGNNSINLGALTVGVAPSIGVTFATALPGVVARRVSLCHLRIDGMPANTQGSIGATNHTQGNSNGAMPALGFTTTNIDSDYASTYPLYVVQDTDKIGDTIWINLNIPNSAGAVNISYHLSALLI